MMIWNFSKKIDNPAVSGRSLSCWLGLDAAHNLDRIKALTGATNDQAIADALGELYQSVWHRNPA